MEITLLTAFLGGFLALLSPCGALLLPAFFASALGNRLRLLVHGVIFYLGLAVTLVPLGLGVGALGSLLTNYREALVIGTSILLILLGAAQALGFGFDLSKHLPGAGNLQQRAHSRRGVVRTLLLGAASGVAGFCAGPILGAILTLAMAQGSTTQAGLMLAIYGLGMVAPLVALAAVWSKLSSQTIRALRGRGFRLFGRDLHTTSVITGLLVIGVGILFWSTSGLVTAPSLLPTDVQRWIQSESSNLITPAWDAALVALIAVVIVAAWGIHRRRARAAQQTASSSRQTGHMR